MLFSLRMAVLLHKWEFKNTEVEFLKVSEKFDYQDFQILELGSPVTSWFWQLVQALQQHGSSNLIGWKLKWAGQLFKNTLLFEVTDMSCRLTEKLKKSNTFISHRFRKPVEFWNFENHHQCTAQLLHVTCTTFLEILACIFLYNLFLDIIGLYKKKYQIYSKYRCHPGAFSVGEVLQQFQDFREKFWSKFWISLYIYIFSLLPQLKIGRSAVLGRRFLPNRPPGWPLFKY